MKINLILFTISTDFKKIQNVICEIGNDHPIYLLSPHKAFENEIFKIGSEMKKEIIFISFYEFINQEEMEYCDAQADLVIVNKYNSRLGRLQDYYSEIKKLKNNIILSNLKSQYEIVNKYICADDLGIFRKTWTEDGFFEKIDIKTGLKGINPLSKIKNLLFIKAECNILKNNKESYYLLGKPDRVLQYLKNEENTLTKLSFLDEFLFNLTYKISVLNFKGFPCRFILKQCAKLLKNRGPSLKKMIVPIHAHMDNYSYFSKILDCKYILLQDCYLPNNYTSTYLKYWEGVDSYYIWDKLSEGIFIKHDLHYVKWDSYKDNYLPKIALEKEFTIKKVLFLASGSGDWTALKNRSDEDLMFLALINISKLLPTIEFLFRPHPLWLHKSHQGTNSIQRLMNYANELNLPNFKISGGALQEGLNFQNHQNLSAASSSIDYDINSSDIVFGDHSQSMVTSAERGKIIASISLAKRKEFFSNYSKLGFTILKSEQDIFKFLDLFSKPSDRERFELKYNNSIELYNTSYS